MPSVKETTMVQQSLFEEKMVEIKFRSVDLNNVSEMQMIAEIDMTIPALYDSSFQVNQKTISDRLEQLQKCKEDDFFLVVENMQNEIVGYHFLNKMDHPNGLPVAQVQTLWIKPEYRKKGIATELKRRAETWAREMKLDHISTFVSNRNPAMLALNESLGYEVYGFKLRKKL
jgi:RimJ/RimL family protein N-acetyltransferase